MSVKLMVRARRARLCSSFLLAPPPPRARPFPRAFAPPFPFPTIPGLSCGLSLLSVSRSLALLPPPRSRVLSPSHAH